MAARFAFRTAAAHAAATLFGIALLTAPPASGEESPERDLAEAVHSGDVARATALLDRNPKLLNRGIGPTRWTLLHHAVSDRDTSMVQWLLSRGANVDCRGSERETPLHIAVAMSRDTTPTSRLRTMALLVDAGADLEAGDFAGVTPLHWAAMFGDLEGARLLVERGANVNAVGKREKWIPIHGAAGSGSTDLVRLLLDHGSRLDVRDKAGRTPLAVARMQDKEEVVALLQSRGAPE